MSAYGGLSFTAKEYEMIAELEKLFTKSIKLAPDLWLYILLAVVAVAFVVALVVGLLCGEFRTIKTRMRGVVASPDKTLAEMKLMPASVKKQYKTARMANARPSDFLSQRDLVEAPYRASLISKIWLVTFVATVICTLIAFFVTPLAQASVAGEKELSEFSIYIAPLVVLIVGALLTLVGAIVGKCSYNGAVKLYAKFVPAVDGEAKPAVKGQAQPEAAQQQAAYAQAEQEPVQAYAAEPQESVEYAAEQVAEPYDRQEAYVEQPAEPQVDDRAAAREEAMARMRAEQEAAQARAAEEQARREAQARAAQEQQERLARMEAARAAQAQAQAQTAAPAGTSSADDVIARIEKIDREGAPRETMREVATLLQKERAKPENKTPEQQKKLNEALSKLLKAMSAASRK